MKKSHRIVTVSMTALALLLIASTLYCWADEEITIGASLGLTGPGSIGPASALLDLGLKDCLAIVNEEGGINGKKIRYVSQDDAYKPAVGLQVFRTIMSEYNPLCMFGSGTPVALAVAKEIRREHPVLFTSPSFSAKLVQPGMYPSVFVPGPTYGDQLAVALKYIAREKKGARVAFFYSKGPMGEDPIPYGRIMCRRLRLKLVAEVVGDIKGGDHTQQIDELKLRKPDFVIMHGWVGPTYASLIQQCTARGLESRIVVTLWGAMKTVVDRVGSNSPGFLAVSPYSYWWNEESAMIRKIKAYTARNYDGVTYRPLTYMVAFTSGLVFVECLKRADRQGRLNAKGLIKALESMKDCDTGGLTPPLTFRNNRFPVARILKSRPDKGLFEPLGHWISF